MSKAILLTSGRDKRIERVQKNRLSQKIMRVSNEMNQNGFYKGKKSQTNSDYIDGFMPKKTLQSGFGTTNYSYRASLGLLQKPLEFC